ncbi:DUF5675 family protein [Sphingobacterium cavernae]|uniref:DUF5675 family protein n=1 Tax=Sphingobacterium cavernae TaxID=2592657 RepID=UPI00122FBD88|nr:DUF5675 family protein [Sphingobacterium cavernae]
MKAQITRKIKTARQTLGEFVLIDDKGNIIFKCKTLELPWKDNQKQKSCIPAGDYNVVPRTSQKFSKHFHILDVPNRDYILIHTGNYRTQILGCVLVGAEFKDLNGDGDLDVTSSKITLDKILSLAPKGFKLTIV